MVLRGRQHHFFAGIAINLKFACYYRDNLFLFALISKGVAITGFLDVR